MKDKILYFLLGVLTMIVVYGFTQTSTPTTATPSRRNSVEQEIQLIKTEITDMKTKMSKLQTDVTEIKSTTKDIEDETSQLDDIYLGVDAIGTELVSPVGGHEGLRADVDDIKSTVYSINSTVRRIEIGSFLLYKNDYSGDTGGY